MLSLCATILAAAALYFARSVFVPVAFSMLAIALVWPLQQLFETRIPKLLASIFVILTTLLVIVALAAAVAWGFSMIGEWLVQNTGKFQSLHLNATNWLESHGISITGFVAQRLDVGWIIRFVQDVAGRMRSFAGFFLLVVIAFTAFAGLELATAWGIMAFTLNYIPFIGPFIATILPTLFAVVQFESWQMAGLIFLGSTLIQFLIGNYLEPRLFGSILDISPYLTVFAVFFWAFLWGVPGAFIGVPVTIALLTCCEAYPSTRWIATLLSGRAARAQS